MKKILLFLLLLVAAPAFASTPGQWDVGAQPITYPIIGSSGVYTEVNGDGSNAHGGLAPFFALQPADIPSTITTQVTEGVGVGTTTGRDELKVRFTLYGSHVAGDDMLRNHCDRGASHGHEFLGGRPVGACSTFTQIRTDCLALRAAGKIASTNPGDDAQCSPYWHPWLQDRNPLGDGVDRIKKAFRVPLYYQIPDGGCGGVTACLITRAASFIDFPLGIGFVSGSNMDDPWMQRLTNAVAAANAANVAAGGTGGRYTVNTGAMGPRGDGFLGWSCINTATGAARSGPFDNTEDLTCNAGDTLIGEIHGAGCVDGKNLYSPSGYDHVIPPIQVSATNGTFQDVCPKNWYKIPQLIFKPQWILKSAISGSVANDSPYLSSDAAYQTKARTFTGHESFVCKAGCSLHNDYVVAYQLKYLRRIFRKCLAIPQSNPGETGVDADQTVYGTACDSNTISWNGTSGSTFNISHLTPPTEAQVNGDLIQEYYPAPPPKGHMGPGTITH